VVKLSWSIASLTRGFSGLNSDTPRGDQAATKGSYQDEKRSLQRFRRPTRKGEIHLVARARKPGPCRVLRDTSEQALLRRVAFRRRFDLRAEPSWPAWPRVVLGGEMLLAKSLGFASLRLLH
jgi:hypothetical protein